jgi:hypothetical protein
MSSCCSTSEHLGRVLINPLFRKRGSVNVRFAPKATEVLRCREPVIRSRRRRGRAVLAARRGRSLSRL